ncbi:ABC transporter permease [Paenibacillus septentrionalis]|uniref:Transport permease protein n=1 Tax=Paenibacillus septentrionalis TaxID=429342 RepID=A0ABW1V800_9BACL
MIGSIFTKEIRLILKDKSTFFWLFALPILFIVIFAAIFSNASTDRGAAIAQIVPGYTVMFVFFIMISMVQCFLRDRDSGMLARLQATLMPPLHFLFGMWMPHVLVLLIQSATLLGFGYFVYGLELGNAAAVLVIVLSLAICATGIGLALSMIIGSLNAAIAIVQIIAMGGAVLGGLWFPFENLPTGVQAIGKFTPQYWALQGLQSAMLDGSGLLVDAVWKAVLLLLGIGAIAIAASIVLYGRYSRTGKHA